MKPKTDPTTEPGPEVVSELYSLILVPDPASNLEDDRNPEALKFKCLEELKKYVASYRAAEAKKGNYTLMVCVRGEVLPSHLWSPEPINITYYHKQS